MNWNWNVFCPADVPKFGTLTKVTIARVGLASNRTWPPVAGLRSCHAAHQRGPPDSSSDTVGVMLLKLVDTGDTKPLLHTVNCVRDPVANGSVNGSATVVDESSLRVSSVPVGGTKAAVGAPTV